MNRSSSTSILATIQLGVVGLGVPVWLLLRVTGGLLPLRPTDLILVVAMIAWFMVFNATQNREETIETHECNQSSPTWFAHRLVDASLLGAGFTAQDETEIPQRLHLISQPRDLSAEDLPSPLLEAAMPSVIVSHEVSNRPQPILQAASPASSSVQATQSYTVARGDTFWSIAEAVLGDGREWQLLQELNLGREVAPNTVLTSNDELRIGWSILLPVQSETDEEHEEASHVA